MNNLLNILLVEDNAGDIMLIKDALEDTDSSVQVNVVNNGEKAIHYLNKEGEFKHSNKPDLVILDINLPRINGHEVLRFIKNNDEIKELPVVMLSSSSADTDINMSYKEYANCYVTKPIGVDEFTDTIHAIKNFWLSLAQLPDKNK
ncbi:response regulator [Rhodohalobacter sp. 8-1]|uniref:response regulator n=1 Tax=Rhodohalobacter sp. 8-1 TaxID=3131972 RepID=UPI0030EC356D